MTDPRQDGLQSAVDASVAKATQKHGTVSAEDIETITRLAKLVEVEDTLRRRKRSRWPALVFGGTLAVVSGLLFGRVSKTEIELNSSMASLRFDLDGDQVLTRTIQLARLGVSGVENLGLPEPPRGQPAIAVSASAVHGRMGTVMLPPVLLPAGTRITVERPGLRNQYRLSFAPCALELGITVDGPVTMGFAGSPAREWTFAAPRPVSFRGGSEEMSLDLTFGRMRQSPFAPLLAVRNLSFARIDEFPGTGRTMINRVSTLASDTLHFESLINRQRELRAGEELTFQESRGWIRTFELAEHNVELKFHGWVSGMAAGTGESRQRLMPTYLEWLEARLGLSLFWAASLYLFALVAGALRWWGVRI